MMLRLKTLIGCLLLSSLIACGGGSGGGLERDPTTGGGTNTGGGGTDTTTERTIVLSLADASGAVSDALSSENPLTLSATVKSAEGNTVNGVLVTFTFAPTGLANFTNDAGTASTGTTGTATIGLTVADNSGAGEIVATLSSGETSTITYNSAGITEQNEQPASLDFYASSLQLASSGSDTIELIALVKNVDNVLMEGIEVTFSANNGASLAIVQGTTAADGLARATLSTQNNKENRTIRVTARTAILATEILDIEVVGTQININGSRSAIVGSEVPLTINVVDSDGKGIPHQNVKLNAQNGLLRAVEPEIPLAAEVSVATSASGQVTVFYLASEAGDDEITAQALNAEGSLEMVVQQDDFSFTSLPLKETEIGNAPEDEGAELVITWLKNGVAYPNGNVTLTSSRGGILINEQLTDVNGQATFVMKSTSAGIAAVSATGTDADKEQVSARAQIEFIATNANSILVDASPDSIGPSGQTSTITAVVRDERGNLIKGKIVNFSVDDVSGGTVSPNQTITDRSGIASTVYTSNAVSSFEAVKVNAVVEDNQLVAGSTRLTVGDRAFDISIGTGRLIEIPTDSSYSKEFSVFVTDPDSNPVPNALLTFSAPPVAKADGGYYIKGEWQWDPIAEIYYIDSATNKSIKCDNEDVNGNGILDAGEDFNKDGLLTPGNVASIQSSATTDANGQVLIDVNYAKQFGGWAEVDITVKAESAGSESKESQRFKLPVALVDLNIEGSPPPDSPFGQVLDCSSKD